jgi:hypothetical protein
MSAPASRQLLGRRVRLVMLGVLCGAAAFLAVKFVWQNALGYLQWDAARYGRYWPVRHWLLMHVVAGLVALFCGPLQLWSGLRGATGHAHRWRGRLYTAGVLVGTVGGLAISLRRPTFAGLGLALTMLAAAWVTTTALAILAIRRGKVEQHKELMVRSYVLTCAFVTFRWWIELPILPSLQGPERFVAFGWLCWTVPLLVTELVLQARRMRATAECTR